MNLNDKVIVITGAAGLLGRSFARKVSEYGGIAILADINLEKAQELSKTVSNSYAFKLNITSRESCEELILYIKEKFGKIDALINNAYPRNKNYGKHFFDVKYEDFCENLGLNLGGYFLVSQVFAKFFIDQGHGNIINIASIYGVIAPRFDIYSGTKMTTPVEYAAIKSGLIHLTKYMASYFKDKNIRVNTVSPGGILDGQPESFLENYKSYCSSKGMLDNVDLSGTICFLLCDESRFINGQNIVVDDGFCL